MVGITLHSFEMDGESLVMSTVSVTNLNAACSADKTEPHVGIKNSLRLFFNEIDEFYKNHDMIRKTVAYVPIVVLGGAHLIEQISSYRLLPRGFWPTVGEIGLWFLVFQARACESSLQEKKIERLN